MELLPRRERREEPDSTYCRESLKWATSVGNSQGAEVVELEARTDVSSAWLAEGDRNGRNRGRYE